MLQWTQRGFSLLEMMMTLAILSILTTIGYPLYTSYLTRAYRVDAESGLIDLAARMERYYSLNNTYVGATVTGVGAATGSENGFYTYAIPVATATAYTVSATPQAAQASNDAACGTLTLNQLNQQGISGSGTLAECWR